MAIIISDIKLPFTEPPELAVAKALRMIGNPSDAKAVISRRSIDARRRGNIQFVYSIVVSLPDGIEWQIMQRVASSNNQVRLLAELPPIDIGSADSPPEVPPVIAGFGPAGMFAGLLLARCGLNPIIIERGADINIRVEKVENFWSSGKPDTETNVQFGEGGAGAFSDGKLTTRISDSRCRFVLEELAAHGAPEEILYEAKPHIGTDKLRKVVHEIRREIMSLGGKILFNTRLEGIRHKSGKLSAVITNNGEIPANSLLLAIGHSARDTFAALAQSGVPMEPKPFSVGVRIEHLQADIDKALYGEFAGHPLLPPGEYQLSHRHGERAVYTFCMCPGGVVVPAASERGGLVTNGMSEHARDGKNANCALVVSVSPGDFGSAEGAISFQRKLEQSAFTLGGGNYCAPVQTVGQFLGKGSGPGRVQPSYHIGTISADFTGIFEREIVDMLKLGITAFGRKLAGFDCPDAILTAVESRTSSPVRIPRGLDMQCAEIRGLYPCGEGAGYAGGIMSAAVDGISAAQMLVEGLPGQR